MRWPDVGRADVLLACATLLLGAIAVYCARGLEQERLHMREVRVEGAAPGASAPVRPVTVGNEEAAFIEPSLRTSGTAASTMVQPGERDAGDLAVARYHLARLDDPQGRAEAAAQLAGVRQEWEDLRALAGLSARDVDDLVAQEIEAQLQSLRKYYACQADPGCEAAAYPAAPAIADEQLARITGPEKAGRIRSYQAAAEERVFVRLLRDLTVAGSMSDTEAGQLILALAQERKQFVQEAEQAGARVETQSGPFVGYSLRTATAPEEVDDLQRKLDSATRYNARLYERAASVLPAAPLARFKAIQDAALDSYRRKVDEMEVARAARRAAGLP